MGTPTPTSAEAIKAEADAKQQEAEKQASLKQHIVKTDAELRQLKQQISKEEDAAKRGALEEELEKKREDFTLSNVELHHTVHAPDETAKMKKVLARAGCVRASTNVVKDGS